MGELASKQALKDSTNATDAKKMQSFALTKSPEYTLVYLIHLLSRLDKGITKLPEDSDLTREELRFSENIFDCVINVLWPHHFKNNNENNAGVGWDDNNAIVAAALKLVRGV